jgi:hypothetical protein
MKSSASVNKQQHTGPSSFFLVVSPHNIHTMRSVLALFALLALAAVAQAWLVPSSPVLTSKTLLRPAADPEWCPTCVSFMDQVPPAGPPFHLLPVNSRQFLLIVFSVNLLRLPVA